MIITRRDVLAATGAFAAVAAAGQVGAASSKEGMRQ
ncbi:MAG: twin-arginine translocation signal domain-containing protein [Mesorhizobium sp.]|nr:MAG: twin-arginine translocation signal domain-containing protein [Mesorhizobium sp.]RWP69034.1 MAG: twin-arginine translocation signal domain-containing protein [Mesorhizobium sp.]